MKYAEQQFYLRSAEEMKARFAEVPEAVQNTLEVADKCNLEIEFGKLHYPVFHPPEHFTREGYLRHLLADGLRKRYGIQARAEEHEFVIERVEDPRRLPTCQKSKVRRPSHPTPVRRRATRNAQQATSPIPQSPPPSRRSSTVSSSNSKSSRRPGS